MIDGSHHDRAIFLARGSSVSSVVTCLNSALPIAALTLCLGGCARAGSHSERSGAPIAGDSLVRIFHSAFEGPPEAVRQVVRNPVDWRRAWSETRRAATDSAPPPVDFSKHMVVIAGMGVVPATGYELFVDSVTSVEWGTLIFVRSTSTTGCSEGSMTAEPVDIVRVPKTRLPVQFVESTEVHRCPE
jgi:hypothetical protein